MLVGSIDEKHVSANEHVTIRDEGPYSARNTSKGALVEEAARLFAALASGESIERARDQILRGTLLTQRSSENRKRIWTLLRQRYLGHELPWLTELLTKESRLGAHCPEFTSLLYLLFALRDRLTFDFVVTVLWPKGYQSRPVVSRNDLLDLLKTATADQSQIDRWSESTRIKLAGSVLTALRDFGLLLGRQKKVLVQPPLPLSTAAALLRILITEGVRGRNVLENPTWRLFLLSNADVAQVLGRLAQEGTIGFERAGTTVVLDTPASWEVPE